MSSVPEEAEIVQLLFSFCIYILYSVHDFSSLEERTHYSEPRDNGSGPARYKTQTSLQVCTTGSISLIPLTGESLGGLKVRQGSGNWDGASHSMAAVWGVHIGVSYRFLLVMFLTLQ